MPKSLLESCIAAILEMALNYDKLQKKARGENEGFWTAYSDLMTVLSTLFLLLYAVSTMRLTTVSVQDKVQVRVAQSRITQLEEQVQAFEVLKEGYLKKGASEAEKSMYQDLMSQMKLMEKQATEEKERLFAQAKETEEKAKGLNKYQSMIKNIITANMIAQKEMKSRDKVIASKSQNLKQLRQEMKEKEVVLAQNNKSIKEIESKLQSSIKEIEYAYRSKAASKQKLSAEIERLRNESHKKVEALRKENQSVVAVLSSARAELGKKSAELEEKQEVLVQRQAKLQELESEKKRITEQLREEQSRYQSTVENLRSAHERKMVAEREAFKKSLDDANLSALAKIEKERAYRAQVENQVNQYNKEVANLAKQLDSTKSQIVQKERELAGTRDLVLKKEKELESQEAQFSAKLSSKDSEYAAKLQSAQAEKSRILGELEARSRGYEQRMKELDGNYQKKLGAERAQFEASLAKEKLSGAEKEAREKAYRSKMEEERLAYEAKMKGLAGELDGTKAAIAQKESQYQMQVGKLASQNEGLSKQLAVVRAREEQKKRVIKKIADSFATAGINAQVNPNTGDVTINFGDEYFDYGSSKMKTQMKSILERAMPLYAKSVLEDNEIAERISSVEIIGFASPTFKGKYINPKELSPEARSAVNYNMDLSYKRAKSIFEHVFDPKAMNYAHQNRLLNLTKVTGLGYLRAQGAEQGGKLSDAEYCDKYDCTKSQKVLIKFNFKE
jgi:myosin heavy subunit